MVSHLHGKVDKICTLVDLLPGDLVLDIGSNDGTTLSAYPKDLLLVGMDPTGEKFRHYYADHVHLIADFFSERRLSEGFPYSKAKVVTSFSMFYDLEDPIGFAREVASVLHAEGIWMFEQSYMPLMIERNAYDTICHEHLEYYALSQIVWLAEQVGLKVVDVELNDINGGSFSVVVAHESSQYECNSALIESLLAEEKMAGLSSLDPYYAFAARTEESRCDLRKFIIKAHSEGKSVAGLGASTKGNVILQYCGFTEGDIEVIGEVNPDKFGAITPGSWIAIDDEREVLKSSPDYLLVLPWHFRDFFLNNPVYIGRNLVFPLPKLEVVTPKGFDV